MNNPLWRNTIISAAVHAAIIALMLVLSAVSCRVRRPPVEMKMFVNIAEIPAAPQPAPPAPPAPKPPEPKKTPAPKPLEPKKTPKPAPPKPAPQPKPQPPLRQQLAEAIRTLDRPQTVQPTGFEWYYALIKSVMYEAWVQPGTLPRSSGLSADVSIRVMRDGTITQCEMIRSSGNATMDNSVMAAVESVKKLQPLPAGMPGAYKDIIITFELTN